LQLHDEIGSYIIQSGEFLVLVPFAKKELTRLEKPDSVLSSSNVACNAPTSNLADTAWSNIMEDLSELRETAEKIDDTNVSNLERNKERTVEVEIKRGLDSEKEIELPYHLILNTLDCTNESALGKSNCEVFSKVLELVNCLSGLPLGHCQLFKRACLMKGACGNDGGGVTCLCPLWLKTVVKSFAFVNIFSAFLHLKGRKLTMSLLEEGLDQFSKFGVKLGLHDMKHLSLLCPHVI
jgi:DEAD/DEAH box helicase domain-containing protein